MPDLEGTGVIEQTLDDLEEDSDVSTNQIIKSLMTSEDLEVKTQITNPLAQSTLDMIGMYFDKIMTQTVTAKDCSTFMVDWNRWFRMNMISYDRQSRKEVVQSVTSVRPEESSDFAKSLLEKAIGSRQ